ncbi:hypothetical protein [Halomonas sp. CKK8]|uniref:hypothetical protein n=1 Tax=Halomonas sp. CKK8 TaxID=3036127 RepID=UPI00241536E9|nr:hypothetical protein [Halomonas sp. CKK8]WFM72509.1 hypothetical protein P8934_05775 [Halomonas sp. CKK8]
MSQISCPVEEGDRVDHKLFGFGTVVGEPISSVRVEDYRFTRAHRNAQQEQWRILVRWDDPERAESSIVFKSDGSIIRKVSSPDSRPFTYWDRQWQPLLKAWLSARREVEQIASSFRPLPNYAELTRAIDAEREAYQAMQEFWEKEKEGKHP